MFSYELPRAAVRYRTCIIHAIILAAPLRGFQARTVAQQEFAGYDENSEPGACASQSGKVFFVSSKVFSNNTETGWFKGAWST